MKTLLKHALVAYILTFALCLSQNCHAQSADANATDAPKQQGGQSSQDSVKSKPKMSFIKTIDFYLRDGKLVSGKLLEEDQSKIVIEQIQQSSIIVVTYPKKEVDPRTIRTSTVAEYKYYIELAEHFAGKTWDFRDDADDFIQAIRCYETAKQSLAASQMQDDEKIAQIDQAVVKIKADREVWIREMESRATLKKLEFDAEFEKRMNDLTKKVDNTESLTWELSEKMDKFLAEIKEQQQKNVKDIAAIKNVMETEFDQIYDRIKYNRSLIDQLSSYLRSRYPHKRPDANDK